MGALHFRSRPISRDIFFCLSLSQEPRYSDWLRARWWYLVASWYWVSWKSVAWFKMY